ncbi:MAG: DUF4314 domain-containing protein [Methanosphaera sp.]|nr:DUF4314 domain-containing protein [Methanobrevibacter sp.]MBQ6444570.1 DUF4314 domain-containing protein [Methanosphaera sp.]
MNWPSKEEVKKIRENYPPGTVIQLIRMDDPTPVPPGTIGEITSIDDAGQIHVDWKDYNSSLAVVPDKDNFIKLSYYQRCRYCEKLTLGATGFECSKDNREVDLLEEYSCEDFKLIG